MCLYCVVCVGAVCGVSTYCRAHGRSESGSTRSQAGRLLFILFFYFLLLSFLVPSSYFCLIQQIWSLLCHVLTDKPDLLRGRHVDQLVMCSIFAVAKSRDIALQFKQIIYVYRQQPTTSAKVCLIVSLFAVFVCLCVCGYDHTTFGSIQTVRVQTSRNPDYHLSSLSISPSLLPFYY